MNLIQKNITTANRYNLCLGNRCNNKGSILLTIKYIHKAGWFCKKCAEELISNKLIEEVNK